MLASVCIKWQPMKLSGFPGCNRGHCECASRVASRRRERVRSGLVDANGYFGVNRDGFRAWRSHGYCVFSVLVLNAGHRRLPGVLWSPSRLRGELALIWRRTCRSGPGYSNRTYYVHVRVGAGIGAAMATVCAAHALGVRGCGEPGGRIVEAMIREPANPGRS